MLKLEHIGFINYKAYPINLGYAFSIDDEIDDSIIESASDDVITVKNDKE